MSTSTTHEMTTEAWAVVPQRLRPPRSRARSFPRPALVARLRSTDQAVVTVRAGAGYGKTTLLGQWVDESSRPFGWVSIDVADNDPVVLLRHVARALGACGADVSRVEDLLDRREPQLTRSVMPALAVALEQVPSDFLLVLDDVHLVEGRESLAVLDELLDLVPDGSTIVLSGRRLPPLRIARRVLDGTVAQLDQADLAYTDQEAATLLRSELPDLPRAIADELLRCTDRWPAGVYLGVLALREHPDPPVMLRGMLSTDRRVVEYLHEEVLDRLRPDLRSFLLRSCVLDRLDAALCDHVLGRTDSAEVLEELAASGNLFVMALAGRGTYRLHDLFADLLLAELRLSDAALEPELRRRAAQWHDQHGESDPAVRQALASGDAGFAAATLYRQLFTTMAHGHMSSLGRWLDGFPPEQVRADGLVALCAGWYAMGMSRMREVAHHLGDARVAEVEGPLPDGTISYQVGLAALEMTASLGGVTDVAAHAAVVRRAGPAGSPWAGMAAFFEALALGLSGRSDLVDELEKAEMETRGTAVLHAVTRAQLGWAHLRRGEIAKGQSLVRESSREIVEHDLEEYSWSVQVHCIRSLAEALAGDDAASVAAAAAAESIISGLVHVMPRANIQAHLLLAEAALERRDAGVAHRLLQVAVADLPREPDAVVLHEWAATLGVRLARERRSAGVVDLTAAESRVLAQLPTHRSLVEIGEHLYVSRNTVKTHSLSIYRKLAVSGRSEAVRRARELGLLDDPADSN